jgi:predicted DNA-binding protein
MPAERPISVRFEPEMIARLDIIAGRLSKVNPNIRIGRSSVVKLAMERALTDIEAELAIERG